MRKDAIVLCVSHFLSVWQNGRLLYFWQDRVLMLLLITTRKKTLEAMKIHHNIILRNSYFHILSYASGSFLTWLYSHQCQLNYISCKFELKKIMKQMYLIDSNKNASPDNIPPLLFQYGLPVLLIPSNQSLSEGILFNL